MYPSWIDVTARMACVNDHKVSRSHLTGARQGMYQMSFLPEQFYTPIASDG